MVNDQEPRYRLVDANGNVVGSLFAESDGTLKLQEGTSGNDNELSLTTQGALEVEQISVAEGSAQLEKTSTQSVASGSVTQVKYGESDSSFSPGSVLTADAANNRITCETTGTFVVSLTCKFKNVTSGARAIGLIQQDGSNVVNETLHTSSSQNIGVSAVAVVAVNSAPSHITARAFHNTGGSAKLAGVGSDNNLSVAQLL